LICSSVYFCESDAPTGENSIYFYVDEEKKVLIIGHIGHKLPNVLYRTYMLPDRGCGDVIQ
jgi:hypothetical protein